MSAAKAAPKEMFEESAEHGPLFVGYDMRDCGEHRTVGAHRAWCYDCSEWCYPGEDGSDACRGCALQILAARPSAASVLRDAAAELDELGLRQAGRVVLRLAAKHEKGASE
jgi:hypothetical protein